MIRREEWKRSAAMWLFPIGLALHDAEEAAMMHGWFAAHADTLARLASRNEALAWMLSRESGSPFRTALAVAIVVAAAFAITALAIAHGRKGFWMLLYEVILGMAALHVFVHIGQAAYLHGYVPGLVGAILILLPCCAFVYAKLFRDGVLTKGRALLTAFAGLVLFPLCAAAAIALACLVG